MKTCVFFGHRGGDYGEYRGYIEFLIRDLIERGNVTQFYSGGRGNFDRLCSEIVGELRKEYPQIKNTLVLSYIPQKKENFELPKRYDDTVYLLEKSVPPRYAIIKTNEAMVNKADFVVVAIAYDWGGAWRAYEYARRKKKRIINVYDCVRGD